MTRLVQRLCTFERLLATLLLLAVVVASALTPMQNDTWWQLRAGRDMWSSWRVLSTDTYSHTAHGAFWPNHEWLAEVVNYGVYRFGGPGLLTLFATALITAAWFFSWRFTAGSGRRRFVMVALALVPASMHWEPRPHAFSLLFLMATIGLLIQRRYRFLPLLFLLWANCHGGVMMGSLVLAVGLGVATLEAPRTWWRHGATLIACLAAMTATPLGISFWTEIPKSLGRIHQYPLDEWQRPGVTDLRLLPFWMIALGLCAALVRYRRTLRPQASGPARTLCASAIALLPMALSAVRNVGPFLMIAVPALSMLLEPATRRRETDRPQPRPFLNLTIMSSAAVAAIVLIAWAYRAAIPRLRWTPLPARSLLALQRCPDNLYNRYDEGGYLIWFAPNHRVFLDGRQDPYEQTLVLEQIGVETTGDYAPTFSRYDIHCAFLPAGSAVARRLSAAAWLTLYRDSNWIVLTDRPAAPSAVASLEY
jgi:hypothetical protein